MARRIGFYGVAHVHAPGLANVSKRLEPDVELLVWDRDAARSAAFADNFGAQTIGSPEELVAGCEIVFVCAETSAHLEALERIVKARKPALIEKPIVYDRESLGKARELISQSEAPLLAALPCAYSPNFELLAAKVAGGEFGKVVAITATNRGRNPGGWFGDPELAGGGAMADHTVHLSDLFWRLLGEQPEAVFAVAGNPMTGGAAEDSGNIVCEYASGVFGTIDFSWSIPPTYPTWGDVKIKVTCERGVYEMNLFGQAIDVYTADRHFLSGYGSSLESKMIGSLYAAVEGGEAPRTVLPDALRADEVMIAAFESVRAKAPIQLAG